MKPNNYYYRHIAIKRGYNWDEKFHSSYYFMRKIAESYGYTYTTRKPSNKFLRDFCTSETEHTPETFEYNIYYLYKIAKKLYPSTEVGKTENYYLRIICENMNDGRTGSALTVTPPTITVTDEFSVTGTLTKDGDSSTKIEGGNVKLQWSTDSTFATYQESEAQQTDSNGAVTFSSLEVTTVTTYYFRMVFLGNTTYAPVTSSVVNVTPSKESTSIDLTSPVNNSSYLSDGTVSFTGTLKELGEDTELIKNAQVLVIQSSTTVGTGTTNNSGAFTITVDADELSTGSVRVKYAGNDTYSESYVDRTITITEPSISSDKSTLSYADSDSCTLSTTLSASGKTVTLYQMLGSTPDPTTDTNLGTMTDNGDGTYEKTYASQGIGDVTFYGKCGTLLTKTFAIEDCSRVNPLTSNDNLWSNNSATISYSTNGMYISNGNWSQFYLLDTLPQGSILEFDITQVNVVSNTCLSSFLSADTGMQTHSTQKDMIATGHYKVVIENGALTWYKDNTLLSTETWTNANSYWFIWTGGARTVTLKNLKIKPLQSIDVSVDNPVLSFADGDTATLTATVNHPLAVGKSITFTAKQGDTVIDTYTTTVDNNSQAEYNYTSRGIGDVDIEVRCMSLTKTFAIKDIHFYDPMTSANAHWILPSGVTFGYNEYSSNGWKLGNASSFDVVTLDTPLTVPFKVSFICTEQWTRTPQINNGTRYVEFKASQVDNCGTNTSHTFQLNKEYHILFLSDKVELYCEDTLISQKSVTSTSNDFSMVVSQNRGNRMKDFKIELL